MSRPKIEALKEILKICDDIQTHVPYGRLKSHRKLIEIKAIAEDATTED